MPKIDLLQGTLDLLILQVLNAGPLHGFAIAQKIHVLSREVLKVEEGSLYPALYRSEQRGWIASEWGTSENNRRAKFYSLTKQGRKQLGQERLDWERLARAIGSVLSEAE
jgi:PadR family transcriptional regulator, regulatory protein PadR